jgi:uncharacterized LabA/DUF88 family protein
MDFVKTGVIWLIDGAYLLKGSQGKIDMIALRRNLQKWANNTRHFDRIIFFNSMKKGDEPQQAFHDWLTSNGFEVKLYGLKGMSVQCPRCEGCFKRQVQKGVDVGIATAILELSDQYTRLVLTAGDGDLIEAIRVVQSKFRQVYVNGFNGSMSGEFRKEANDLMILNI